MRNNSRIALGFALAFAGACGPIDVPRAPGAPDDAVARGRAAFPEAFAPELRSGPLHVHLHEDGHLDVALHNRPQQVWRFDSHARGARSYWVAAGDELVGEARAERAERLHVLDEMPRQERFDEQLLVNARSARAHPELVEIFDDDGEPALRVHRPVARDARGVLRIGTIELVREQPRLELHASVALAGLVPPIVVDPIISSATAPALAREGHTVVELLDGRIALIGGRTTDGTDVAAIELLDPLRGTWSVGPSLGASQLRHYHSANLLHDGRVLLAGGQRSSVPLETTDLYDPRTGEVTSGPVIAPLPTGVSGLSGHTATRLPSGDVLFAGGSNGASGIVNAWLYRFQEGAPGTVEATGSLAEARAGATASLLEDGSVLVVGGTSSGTRRASAERFVDGTFSSAGTLATGRVLHAMVRLPGGEVLVLGGFSTTELDTAELWSNGSVPSGSFTSTTGRMTIPRRGHAVQVLPSGQVLVVGGQRASNTYAASSETYARTSNSFLAGVTNAARESSSTTALGAGRVLVFGGLNNITPLATTELVDAQVASVSAGASLPAGLARHTVTLLADGTVLVAGGTTNGTAALASSHIYDPQTDTLTSTDALLAARMDHSATLLEDGRVLVAGGTNGTTDLSSAELYEPSTRTFSAAGALTHARAAHTATLLPSGEILVVGGTSSSLERFHVPSRRSVATSALPAARREHLAVRQANGDVLLVGGLVDNVTSASVLRYTPATGALSAAPALGVARRRAAAVLLGDGSTLVVGGLSTNGTALAGAERLTAGGSSWSTAGTLTTARSEHAAVLAPSGRALVVGGRDGANGLPLGVEAFDPMLAAFSSAGSLATGRGRAGARVTLLADGRVLVVGGSAANSVAFTDRIDEVGVVSDRPALTSPASLGAPDSDVTLSGTALTAAFRADGAVARLVSSEGVMISLPITSFTPGTALRAVSPSVQPGAYRLFVATGGPVGGRVVRIEPRPSEGTIPVAAPSTLVADGISEADIDVGPVLDKNGATVADGALVTLRASDGALIGNDADPILPDLQVPTSFGHAVVRLRSSTTLGTVTLDAVAVIGTAQGSGVVEFIPGPGSGAIPVTASTTTLVADGGATTSIDVGPVRDAQGHIVTDGSLVEVTSLVGTLVGFDADTAPGLQLATTDGLASFSLRAPTSAGQATVRLRTVVGDAAASLVIVFVAGPPTSPVPVGASPASLPADGSTLSTISVGPVVDARGNVVADGTKFTVSTTAGLLVGVDVDDVEPGLQRVTTQGRFTVQLRAPLTSGSARVDVATLDSLASGATTVALVPAPAEGTFAVTPFPSTVIAGGAPVRVVAGPILNAAGTLLEDGALFTATTDGVVLDNDLDPVLVGVQRAAEGGQVEFHIDAGTTAGNVAVNIRAAVGSASGASVITVVPAAPHHVELRPPARAIAGAPATIALVALDAFDNVVTDAAIPVCVSAIGLGGGAPVVAPSGLEAGSNVDPAIACGTFRPGAFVTVTDELVENVELAVASTGLAGSGTPDMTAVLAVEAAAGNQLVLSPEDGGAEACGQEAVTVRLFDVFGNRARPSANLLVRLSVSGDGGVAQIVDTDLTSATDVPAVDVLGFLPNTGEASVVVTLAGAGALELTASAALAEPTAPAAVEFHPGAVSPSASTVTVLADSVQSGAGSTPVEVVPEDACGVRLGPGQAVSLRASYGTLDDVVDEGDGSYTSTFRTAAGECPSEPAQITAVVDGVALEQVDTVSVLCSSVGEPPVLERTANLFGARERPYVYDDDRRVLAQGTPPIRYSLEQAPDGVFINDVTGRLDWFPLQAGVFTLEVVATNPAGEDRYAFEVDIAEEPPPPPSATVLAAPLGGPAPLEVSFNGSQSTASPGASLLVSRWDFGDGSPPIYAERAEHTYLRPGGYLTRLLLADSLGGTGSGSAEISVTDGEFAPPIARIRATATDGNELLDVTFSCNCTPGDGEIAGYLWTLSDGTTSVEPSFTHSFPPGTHEVRLVVTDVNGLAGIDRRQIVVLSGTQVPPEVFAQASPVAGEAPLVVTFTADAGDLDGQLQEVRWEFSDGAVTVGDEVEHAFTEPGLYLATVVVVDDDGLEGRATVELQVTGGGDVPPVVLSRPITTGLVGERWSYDGDGKPAARGDRPLVWSLGKQVDGQLFGAPPGATVDAQTGRITWTPSTPGVFPVVLVVQNPAGITAQQFDVLVDGEVPGGGKSAAASGCGCGSSSESSSLWAVLGLLALRAIRTRPVLRNHPSTRRPLR